MKISHLEAMAQVKGFEGLQDYLETRYIKDKQPIDVLADELEIGPAKVRKILAELRFVKPKKAIPMSLADAKRLGPDALAIKYKVSRATAWRWKRAILRKDADASGDGVIASLDAGARLDFDGWPLPSGAD